MILGRIASRLRHRDWDDALIELAIVVLGILIAFQVEEYRQFRNDRIQERLLLAEISSDLEATRTDLSTDLENGRERLSELYRLIDELLYNSESYVSSDRSSIASMLGPPKLFPKIGAYESLRSSGLNLISDRGIRKRITNFYELRLPRIAYFEAGDEEVTLELAPILTPFIEIQRVEGASINGAGDIEDAAPPSITTGLGDVRLIAGDANLTPLLHLHYGRLRRLVEYYEEALRLIDALVEDIDAHLATL